MLLRSAIAAAYQQMDGVLRILLQHFAGCAFAHLGQFAQIGRALQQNGRGEMIERDLILVLFLFGARTSFSGGSSSFRIVLEKSSMASAPFYARV